MGYLLKRPRALQREQTGSNDLLPCWTAIWVGRCPYTPIPLRLESLTTHFKVPKPLAMGRALCRKGFLGRHVSTADVTYRFSGPLTSDSQERLSASQTAHSLFTCALNAQ